jgi:RNA-binding protein 23/39
LPLKAKEKDIWNFFFRANSGKIRDIRIIRDARSGRSKGVAYVEFYNS